MRFSSPSPITFLTSRLLLLLTAIPYLHHDVGLQSGSQILVAALPPVVEVELRPFSPAFLSGIDDDEDAILLDLSYSTNTTSEPLNSSSDSSTPQQADLKKRQSTQDTCPSNASPCSSLNIAGAAASCCAANSLCTTDNIGHIACCPLGSFCTGTLSSSPTPPPAPTPTTTTGTNTIISHPSGSATFLTNALFPYPVLPTTFPNAAACTSAYAACTTNFAVCTADLSGAGVNGAGFGVTISAPNGGGVTVAPSLGTISLGAVSASSVCASLSSQACPGSSATCSVFGAGTGGAGATTTAAGGGGGGGNTPTQTQTQAGGNGGGPSFLATTTQGFTVVTPGAGAGGLWEESFGRAWWAVGLAVGVGGWLVMG